MDTIVIFEKEMNTHEKEEARRKWKNPGWEAMCRSFIFVFRTKQIKYRAHSDTGHCITFGCTSWFDIHLNIYRRFLINPCDLRSYRFTYLDFPECLIRNKQNYLLPIQVASLEHKNSTMNRSSKYNVRKTFLRSRSPWNSSKSKVTRGVHRKRIWKYSHVHDTWTAWNKLNKLGAWRAIPHRHSSG